MHDAAKPETPPAATLTPPARPTWLLALIDALGEPAEVNPPDAQGPCWIVMWTCPDGGSLRVVRFHDDHLYDEGRAYVTYEHRPTSANIGVHVSPNAAAIFRAAVSGEWSPRVVCEALLTAGGL